MEIKLLLTNQKELTIPLECTIKEFEVPLNIFEIYGINTIKEIIESMNEMTDLECISWVNGIEKKVYYEPDFDDEWEKYIIMEED